MLTGPTDSHKGGVKVVFDINYKVVQAKRSGDRTNWIPVGMAFKRQDKFSMKLDTYPIPNEKGEVWLQLYERMEGDEVQKKNEESKEQETLHPKSYGGTAK
jgi:DNA-binding beta-propeller fold protein YncE